MSHVKLSAQANLDLVRLYEFLAQYDVATADRAVDSIIASLGILEKMPQGCQLVAGRKDIRNLVINFGASGRRRTPLLADGDSFERREVFLTSRLNTSRILESPRALPGVFQLAKEIA